MAKKTFVRRYLASKYQKEFIVDLKTVYPAPNREIGQAGPDEKWSGRRSPKENAVSGDGDMEMNTLFFSGEKEETVFSLAAYFHLRLRSRWRRDFLWRHSQGKIFLVGRAYGPAKSHFVRH